MLARGCWVAKGVKRAGLRVLRPRACCRPACQPAAGHCRPHSICRACLPASSSPRQEAKIAKKAGVKDTAALKKQQVGVARTPPHCCRRRRPHCCRRRMLLRRFTRCRWFARACMRCLCGAAASRHPSDVPSSHLCRVSCQCLSRPSRPPPPAPPAPPPPAPAPTAPRTAAPASRPPRLARPASRRGSVAATTRRPPRGRKGKWPSSGSRRTPPPCTGAHAPARGVRQR